MEPHESSIVEQEKNVPLKKSTPRMPKTTKKSMETMTTFRILGMAFNRA
jgi:hypothetical protein